MWKPLVGAAIELVVAVDSAAVVRVVTADAVGSNFVKVRWVNAAHAASSSPRPGTSASADDTDTTSTMDTRCMEMHRPERRQPLSFVTEP